MSSNADDQFPKQCSALRKGDFVMLKGRACKIVDMSTSKTGKHGHAKVHLTGLDIFDNKKQEDICPSTHNMQCPNVKRKEYQLIDIDEDGQLSLMDDGGNMKEDLKVEDATMKKEIAAAFDGGDNDVLVTVQSAVGREQVVSHKKTTSKN